MPLLANIDNNIAKLKVTAEQLKDPKNLNKALDASGEIIKLSIQNGFKKQKDPKGKNWAPLSPNYTNRPLEGEKIFGLPIIDLSKNPTTDLSKPLIHTGDMRQHIDKVVVDQYTVVIGYTDKESGDKGKKHQNGTASDVYLIDSSDEDHEATVISIKPAQRKQIGFATWSRVGSKPDKAQVLDMFREVFRNALRK